MTLSQLVDVVVCYVLPPIGFSVVWLYATAFFGHVARLSREELAKRPGAGQGASQPASDKR